MLNGQYIKLSVNGASTICGFISTVINQWLGRCYAYWTYWHLLFAKELAIRSPPHSYHERQWSVNNLWSCKYSNSQVTCSLLCITDVLAAFIGKRDSNIFTAPFLAWASTERQRFVVSKYGNSQVTWSLLCITDVLAAFIGKRESNTVTAPFLAWASTKHQQFVVL